MGHRGCFVVGRDERPLAERDAPACARGTTLRTSAPGGRQVREYPGGDGGRGNTNDLAGEAGAPASFGCVRDSARVVVEAAAPKSGARTTCLARSAMAGHLGAPAAGGTGGADGAGGAQDGAWAGLTREDCFPAPRDAAGRAVEAGRTVSAEELAEVLEAGPDHVAENLFFELLHRLGVVPL